jgi:hypothetical protein
VEPFLLADLQKCEEKLMLKERFSAGKTNTSTRFFEKHGVFVHLVQNFLNYHFLSDNLPCLRVARLNTIATLLTKFTRSNKDAILPGDCAILAEIYAIAAADAAILAKDQFFLGRY